MQIDKRLEFTDFLNDQFLALKAKNSRYSRRSYAAKLGVSVSSLSEMMKGTWVPRPSRMKAMIRKMKLSPAEERRALLSFSQLEKEDVFTLESRHIEFLKNWRVFPILFSFDLPMKLRPSVEELSKKLGASVSEVQDIIDALIDEGLLIKDKNDEIQRKEGILKNGSGISDDIISTFHKSSLELGLQKLTQLPPEQRDFSSFTFVGHEKGLNRLKKEIQSLLEKAPLLIDEGEANDKVYRLQISLFPIL